MSITNNNTTVYIIYLCQKLEVTPLAECSSYKDAETQMDQHIRNYMLTNHPGEPRTSIARKDFKEREFRKYSDFKCGVVFVRDKHETTIYRKTAIAGSVYGHTFQLELLGKISVVECLIADSNAITIKKLTDRISELQLQASDAKLYQERAENYSKAISKMDCEMERLQVENSKLRDRNEALQQEVLVAQAEIASFKEEVMEALRDIAANNGVFRAPSKKAVTPEEKELRESFNPVLGEIMAWFSSGEEPKRIKPKRSKNPPKAPTDEEIIQEMLNDLAKVEIGSFE